MRTPSGVDYEKNIDEKYSTTVPLSIREKSKMPFTEDDPKISPSGESGPRADILRNPAVHRE